MQHEGDRGQCVCHKAVRLLVCDGDFTDQNLPSPSGSRDQLRQTQPQTLSAWMDEWVVGWMDECVTDKINTSLTVGLKSDRLSSYAASSFSS